MATTGSYVVVTAVGVAVVVGTVVISAVWVSTGWISAWVGLVHPAHSAQKKSTKPAIAMIAAFMNTPSFFAVLLFCAGIIRIRAAVNPSRQPRFFTMPHEKRPKFREKNS